MLTLFMVVSALTFAYLAFVAIRLGLHQRLPLALGRISLEKIIDRAAAKHGEKTLFTSDLPCAWDVPALRGRFPDATAWSAVRIKVTVSYLAQIWLERFNVRHEKRVAILKENHLDIHFFTAPVVRAGGIACPINGNFAARDLQPYLRPSLRLFLGIIKL